MIFANLPATGASASENLSIFDPVSPPGEAIRQLLLFVLVVVGVIFVLVEVVLVYSIIRFRAKPAVNGVAAEPGQVYGSTPIEVAWTVAPALIVFLLVLLIVRTVFDVRVPPPEPAPGDNSLFVTVIGHQWWWEYVYESYDGEKLEFITANELHVPAVSPVYLKLEAADVCHSFWVPRLAGKTDLIPGKTNTMWFSTEEPGLYLGQCAEYCGTQHAKMLLRVNVESPDEFRAWLDNQKKPARDIADVQKGRDVFLSQSCINCHRVRGTRAAGTYAPDLTHLASRQTLASGIIPNGRDNLRRWVADPQSIKRGCLMPAFGLADDQIDLVVDYLMTLE